MAATLLGRASKMAVAEGRGLILQSLLSDSVERYYLARGFRRQYLKLLMAKEG